MIARDLAIGARIQDRLPTLGRILPWKSELKWLVPLGLLYLSLAVFLGVTVGYHEGDALSRTANGYFAIFGRQPHLAAIGFVWTPLPSLVQIPLLALLRPFGLVALAGPVMRTAASDGATLTASVTTSCMTVLS